MQSETNYKQKSTLIQGHSDDSVQSNDSDSSPCFGELEALFANFDDTNASDEEEHDTLADHNQAEYQTTCNVLPRTDSFGDKQSVKTLSIRQDLKLNQRVIDDDCIREGLSETERESATGAVIWNAGVVLGKFIQWQCHLNQDFRRFVAGSNCIELGAGTGLCALLAAASGANVVASDRDEMLPLIQENVLRNSHITELNKRVRVCKYNWGKDLDSLLELDTHSHNFFPPYDIIFAADCVYDFNGIDPLQEAVRHLAHSEESGKHTLLLLAYDHAIGHKEVYKDFFRAAKRRGIDFHQIDFHAQNPQTSMKSVRMYQALLNNSSPMNQEACGKILHGTVHEQPPLPFQWMVCSTTNHILEEPHTKIKCDDSNEMTELRRENEFLRIENQSLSVRVRELEDALSNKVSTMSHSNNLTSLMLPKKVKAKSQLSSEHESLVDIELWKLRGAQTHNSATRVMELQRLIILNGIRPRSQIELIEKYLRGNGFDVDMSLQMLKKEELAERHENFHASTMLSTEKALNVRCFI